MRKIVLVITVGVLLMASCTQKKSVPEDIQNYVGDWEVTIYKLPKVGDKILHTHFVPKDSILTGYFTEDNGGRTEISEIIIDGDEMKCEYNWGGHKVSYKVEMNEATKDTFEGRMMGFFKVEGVRKED